MGAGNILQAIARAYLEKERQRVGIPQQELVQAEIERRRASAANEQAQAEDVPQARALRALQLRKIQQELDLNPAEQQSQINLRNAQAEAAHALSTQRETPKVPSGIEYKTDEAGNVTAVIPQIDVATGATTFKTAPIGKIGQRPADIRPDAPKPGAGGTSDTDAAFLLQGGTADKLPAGTRSAAVAAAKASGGLEGTGFVPMTGAAQLKFNDFRDLHAKALRLYEILTKHPELGSKLGPVAGRYVGATKELGLGLGQDTLTKEAFDLFKDLSDVELRRRSGAAISPGEYARITGFTVDPTKQLDSNLTNLNRMIDVLEGDLGTLGVTNLPHRQAAGAGAAGGVSPKVQAILNYINQQKANAPR